MQIHGLQGLDDPQTIRDEVARGGRFVIYTYCISILVMSFKRGSDIYFIRPGHSAVFRGLPFTLVSFFLGWWGFPWGIIYTFEALIKNLGGGTDITAAILADLDRSSPPPVAATTDHSGAPPPLPLRGEAPPPAESFPSTEPRAAIGAGIFRLALLIVAVGLAGWMGVAIYRGQNIQTALVNGLDTPVTISLDGEARPLSAQGFTLLTLSEGEHSFSWTRPDGREETTSFTVATPFWSRPLERHVAIVNPDRIALVYQETTRYYPEDQPLPEGKNDIVLHAGQASYTFPAGDYFFEDFPARISLGSRRVVAKSRHHHASFITPVQRLFALQNDTAATPPRDLALRLGELYPDDEMVLHNAISLTPSADIETFFAAHLDERPIRLEWHRAYQHHLEYHRPEIDLVPRYRRLAAEFPEDGAAAYLAGRIETDPVARQAYFRQAVNAPNPCAYAHNSLAYETLSNGDFPAALTHLRDAEKAGLDSLAFQDSRRQVLLANGLHDEALAHIRAARAREPETPSSSHFGYLAQELAISCQRDPSDSALESRLTASYLAAVKPHVAAEEHTRASFQLAATAAYARGDEEAYARRLAGVDDSRFAVAITTGDHAAASAALRALPRAAGGSWLLVYLAARAAGDTSAADEAFAAALAAFAAESREHRAIATRLRTDAADPAVICAEILSADEKCVLATALGHRFPEHRAAYHALAAKLNFKPEFPALFITRQLLAAAPATASR